MRVTRLSDHIYRLGTWFIIPFNVWVVVEDDGVVLVDTGIPSMGKNILRFIDGLGKGPLTKILLTHGHSDHVGSIPAILADRKVPVYVNDVEKPFMEGTTAYPGRKPRVLLASGIAEPLTRAGEDLATVGSLTPYPTPGHAPGHVVYHHPRDGILLARRPLLGEEGSPPGYRSSATTFPWLSRAPVSSHASSRSSSKSVTATRFATLPNSTRAIWPTSGRARPAAGDEGVEGSQPAGRPYRGGNSRETATRPGLVDEAGTGIMISWPGRQS